MQRFKILVIVFILMAVGCTTVPSSQIFKISKFENSLILSTNEGVIKSYDAETNEVINRMQFPDMEYGSSHVIPSIRNIVNGTNLTFESNQGIVNSIGIYQLVNNELVKKTDLPINTYITTTDTNYAYGVEITNSTPDSSKYRGTASGILYDLDYHTKSISMLNNSNRIILHTWYNSKDTWYVCIDNKGLYNNNLIGSSIALSGNIVIVSKTNNVYAEYPIEGNYDTFSDELDSVWFFESGSGSKIRIFSKNDKTTSSIIPPFKLVPIPHGKLTKSSKYLWAARVPFDNKIYRFNKDDLKYISVTIPDEVLVSSWLVPIYSDDNYIWVGAWKHRNLPPFMNDVPYLVKLNKNNSDIQVVLAKPTIGEAIGAVFESFFSWLRAPFYMFYKT